MDAGETLTFIHVLAAFWYVAGLTAVQLPLTRSWQSEDLKVRAQAFEEASHYQGVLLVPGAITAGAFGVFLWAQEDYSLIGTGWLLLLAALYIITLLVCLPLSGLALRRGRQAALQIRKGGASTEDVRESLSEGVPLFFLGIATLLVPAMAFLSVVKPF